MKKITDDERNMMLGYAVQSFRIQAGYIPKIAPENECNRVDFRVEIDSRYLHYYYQSQYAYLSSTQDESIGEVRQLHLYAKLCIDCATALETYYDSPTVSVISSLKADELCNACANSKYGSILDDIPF